LRRYRVPAVTKRTEIVETACKLEPNAVARASSTAHYQAAGDRELAAAIDVLAAHGRVDEQTGDRNLGCHGARIDRYILWSDAHKAIALQTFATERAASRTLELGGLYLAGTTGRGSVRRHPDRPLRAVGRHVATVREREERFGGTHVRAGARRCKNHTRSTLAESAENLAQPDGHPARPAPVLAATDLDSTKDQGSQPVVGTAHRPDHPHLFQTRALHRPRPADHPRAGRQPGGGACRTPTARDHGLRSPLACKRPVWTDGAPLCRQTSPATRPVKSLIV